MILLVDLVADHAQSVLRQEIDLISRLVSRRKRFENWLQIGIYKRLIRDNRDIIVELERPYPIGSERCDFWSPKSDNCENWVEPKICVTNYVQNYTELSSPRPITNQIDSVIADIEKLRRISLASSFRHVFLLAYPIPVGDRPYSPWEGHLDKIRKTSTDLSLTFMVKIERGTKEAAVHGYKISL
jgi:hypothetical protein